YDPRAAQHRQRVDRRRSSEAHRVEALNPWSCAAAGQSAIAPFTPPCAPVRRPLTIWPRCAPPAAAAGAAGRNCSGSLPSSPSSTRLPPSTPHSSHCLRRSAMKGHDDIIELLNDVLTAELTAVNQYFLDAKMFDNWGYERLGHRFRDESIDEMKDADKL